MLDAGHTFSAGTPSPWQKSIFAAGTRLGDDSRDLKAPSERERAIRFLLQFFRDRDLQARRRIPSRGEPLPRIPQHLDCPGLIDRKSTRLNSSHLGISYA